MPDRTLVQAVRDIRADVKEEVDKHRDHDHTSR